MHEQVKALKIMREELGDDEVVYAWVEAPFQESAMLRNINYLMVDIYDNPKLVHELMRFSLEMELAYGLAQIEATGVGVRIVAQVDLDHSVLGPHLDRHLDGDAVFGQGVNRKSAQLRPQVNNSRLHIIPV